MKGLPEDLQEIIPPEGFPKDAISSTYRVLASYNVHLESRQWLQQVAHPSSVLQLLSPPHLQQIHRQIFGRSGRSVGHCV